MTHVSSRAARLTKQSLGKSGLGHRECQCPENPPRPLLTVSPSHRVRSSTGQRCRRPRLVQTQLKLSGSWGSQEKSLAQSISGPATHRPLLGHWMLVSEGGEGVNWHSLAPPNHLKITHTTIRRSHIHRPTETDGGKKGGKYCKIQLRRRSIHYRIVGAEQ